MTWIIVSIIAWAFVVFIIPWMIMEWRVSRKLRRRRKQLDDAMFVHMFGKEYDEKPWKGIPLERRNDPATNEESFCRICLAESLDTTGWTGLKEGTLEYNWKYIGLCPECSKDHN
jgi:hypothetical protein